MFGMAIMRMKSLSVITRKFVQQSIQPPSKSNTASQKTSALPKNANVRRAVTSRKTSRTSASSSSPACNPA